MLVIVFIMPTSICPGHIVFTLQIVPFHSNCYMATVFTFPFYLFRLRFQPANCCSLRSLAYLFHFSVICLCIFLVLPSVVNFSMNYILDIFVAVEVECETIVPLYIPDSIMIALDLRYTVVVKLMCSSRCYDVKPFNERY